MVDRKKPKRATEHFEDIIGAFNLPVPTREQKFHDSREWRFDYCWPDAMIAVEIHGGRWHRADMDKDYEKVNEAQALGWTVFQFSTKMLGSEERRYEVGRFMERMLEPWS